MNSGLDTLTSVEQRDELVRALRRLGTGMFEFVSSMRDEIAVLDRDGRLVVVLGDWPDKSRQDLLGRTLHEIFGSQTAGILGAAHIRALEGEYVAYEWTRRKGRQLVLLSTAAAPLRDPSSNIVGVILVTRNITPSRRDTRRGDDLIAEKTQQLLELEEGIQQLAGAIESYRKGVPPREFRAGSPLRQLSSRERQVLDLLGQGYRPRSIAEKLHVSPETVRNHLKAMFKKTGTHSQEELTAMLRASRIL